MKSLDDALLHYMQDILYAEKTALKAMKKVVRAVEAPELKQQLEQHAELTQQQVDRLNQCFEHLGKRARGKTCAAMDGLIEECQEAVEEGEKGPVLDAVLIASVQAMEHYEIARYGAMVAFARQLGHDEVAELLQQTLAEEKEADQRLNDLAEANINAAAASETDESDEDDDEEEAAEAEPEEAKPAPKKRAAKK